MFGNNSGGGLFASNNNNGGGGLFGGGNNNNNNIPFGGSNNNNNNNAFGGNNNNSQSAHFKDVNVGNPSMLPSDTVQCIKWCKNQNQKIFVTGDWAGDIKIYQVQPNNGGATMNLMKSVNVGGPVFKVDWSQDSTVIFIACADGKVKAMQVQSGQITDIAMHQGITSMEVVNLQNNQMIVTIGSDQKLMIWKLGQNQPQLQVQLQKIPFVSDFQYPFLVMGCNDYTVAVINFEQFINNQKIFYCQCNLKSPIMSIAIRPNSKRIAIGSVDGRICATDMEFGYNNSQLKLKDYILFRAHRKEVKNQPQNSYLYQVNCLGFHASAPNFLYSCGSNSICYYWDCIKKNKSAEFNYGGIPITAADYSPCGNLFAYALGYDWSKGIWGLPEAKTRPYICVHIVQKGEVKK